MVFKQKTTNPETGRPLWAYRVREGGRGSRRIQVGGFKTNSEAARARRDALDKMRRGIALRSDLTVAELVDEFLAQYVGVQANTRRTTVDRLKYLTRPRDQGGLGDVRIDRLTTQMIALWRARLPEGSAWGIHKAASQVGNYAARVAKVLPENPFREVRNPEPRRQEIKPFDDLEEVEAIGEELTGSCGGFPGYQEVPLFAALTGLRPRSGSRCAGATSTSPVAAST